MLTKHICISAYIFNCRILSYYDETVPSIEAFEGNPRPLNNPICTEKVTEVVKKIGNNKAAGFDSVFNEVIKNSPKIIF